jgi:DNA-directed RNA polymerase subunit RPC12/RpoP
MERLCLICGRTNETESSEKAHPRLCCDDCRSLLQLMEETDAAARPALLKHLRFGPRVYAP